jgi:hypothetical protein
MEVLSVDHNLAGLFCFALFQSCRLMASLLDNKLVNDTGLDLLDSEVISR